VDPVADPASSRSLDRTLSVSSESDDSSPRVREESLSAKIAAAAHVTATITVAIHRPGEPAKIAR
jgi:hypothetical protein